MFKGEEPNVRITRKTSLGILRAVKQLITVALHLKRRRVDLDAFQSIQLDISRIFYVSEANECELLKRSGHLVKWRSVI